MPVLPAVASTTRPPGLSSPRFSASRIIHLPARSLTDWPGFMNSALPRMVQPVSSEARFSLMRGVRPTAAATPLANGKGDLLGSRAAGGWAGAGADVGRHPNEGGCVPQVTASRFGAPLNGDLTARGQAPAAIRGQRAWPRPDSIEGSST